MNSSLKYLKILSGLYKHSVETIMLCAPESPVLNQETPNNSFCLFVCFKPFVSSEFIHGKQPTLSS